ncbi:LacI family DNA-binding transcriptional regulator [Entomohabitans teleogrylli]|uniref:LacI family DNA-binding transcriptional regulator n=1 Tax=Entomohabitans teleogrylli TaxID=1384589 RepID=UPI00073DB025|nr:LacI family DNA-binding transcriptional regulator [Entomohabitans teleogrylli]
MCKGLSPSTIHDVAREAGVGKTSVSRYLNGEQHRLSDALKRRISEAIARLDYRPNQMARSLKSGQTRMLGLILADVTNPWSIGIMKGIEDTCQQQGFTLLMGNAGNSPALVKEYLQLFTSYRVEGLLINTVDFPPQESPVPLLPDLPRVLIDRNLPGTGSDFVGLHNHEAVQAACQHLIQQQFEAILFLTEPTGQLTPRIERLQAFLDVMAGFPHLTAQTAQLALHDARAIEQQLRQFCQQQRGKRKAVIVSNGALTLQVALAMKHIGLKWGDDIGLLGFDELDWVDIAGTGITTIRQPAFQMGALACQLLIERIHGNDCHGREKRFFGELIIRQSTVIY